MTEEELKNQVARAEQDAITLDYSRWAAQQRSNKLSDNHDLWQSEKNKIEARQKAENDAIRTRRLNDLGNERKAKAEARIEEDLAADKIRIEREWLANNPGKTSADFNKQAWALLKENLIEQRKSEALQREIQAQAASGRYSI